MVRVWKLHGTDQVFSEHLQGRNKLNERYNQFYCRNISFIGLVVKIEKVFSIAFTSAGFFWAEAGVPGLLPYLLEEKDVEGPLWYNNRVSHE